MSRPTGSGLLDGMKSFWFETSFLILDPSIIKPNGDDTSTVLSEKSEPIKTATYEITNGVLVWKAENTGLLKCLLFDLWLLENAWVGSKEKKVTGDDASSIGKFPMGFAIEKYNTERMNMKVYDYVPSYFQTVLPPAPLVDELELVSYKLNFINIWLGRNSEEASRFRYQRSQYDQSHYFK